MSKQIEEVILCSLCNYSTNEAILWGVYEYVISDNVFLHMKRTYGWCYSCKEIKPIEVLPDKPKLEKELEVLNSTRKRWTALTEFKSNRALETVDEKIKEIQDCLKFLNLRKAPPRCLTCGSTDVVNIVRPNVQEGESVQLAFTHPGCGGTFTVKNSRNDSGIRFNWRIYRRLYSVNGQFISKEIWR